MAFLAGETITAGRLNRLQPKTYWAQANTAITGAATAQDVLGASVTFTTETANAQVDITWVGDHRNQTATSSNAASTKVLIDGVTSSPVFTLFTASGIIERGTQANQWQTTLATAGSHTIKVQVTQAANQVIQTYTTLKVVVTENV